jgi:hypothetical protein
MAARTIPTTLAPAATVEALETVAPSGAIPIPDFRRYPYVRGNLTTGHAAGRSTQQSSYR